MQQTLRPATQERRSNVSTQGGKGNRKKQRAHRLSEGKVGAGKHPLTEVEKGLLGKGRVQATHHIPLMKNYRGAFVVDTPFDARQVTMNKILYPHLFRDDE